MSIIETVIIIVALNPVEICHTNLIVANNFKTYIMNLENVKIWQV